MFKWMKRRTHTSGEGTHYGRHVNAITASSAALMSRASRDIRNLSKSQDWQEAAWEYYDIITELHTGANWLATATSRAQLYVGIPDPDGEGEPEPTDNDAVRDVLHQFFGGPAGQADMLRRVTLHLTVPGETWICGWNTPDGDTEWRAVTSAELKTNGQTLAIVPNYGDKPVELTTDNSQVFRIWRPHARDSLIADSPTRSTLPICKEMQGYASHINATTDSRLASGGILIIPHSASLPNPGAGEGTDQTGSPFIEDMVEGMVTSVNNDDSAGRIAPMVVTTADGAVDNIKHLNISTPYDERIQSLREAAIKRLAVGMDMPLEILLGLGDTNHWNAWQIDESAIKLHIEPMLQIICSAITEQYLRPLLQGVVSNPGDFVVWYDTAALVQRPNKGPEARELFDRDELSAEALRRENGFNDEDAPSDEERKNRLLINLLKSSPELASSILPLLGLPPVETPDFPQVTAAPSPRTPAEDAPQISPQDTRPEPPQQQDSVVASKVASYREDRDTELVEWQLHVAEMAALAALGRAGRWLLSHNPRSVRGTMHNIPEEQLHMYLPTKDAPYDKMLDHKTYRQLEQALPDNPCIKRAVDTYVRGLLRAQKVHDRQQLAEVLAMSGCISDGND